MGSWCNLRQHARRRFNGLSRVGRTLISWWLALSLLSAPGAGAVSLVKDVATTPAARAAASTSSQTLQVAVGQLPRLGVAAGVVALLSGILGLPESDPSSVQAQSSNDIVYIYDALGRLRSVVDPAGDAAVYVYDAVGNLLSIGRQAATVTSVVELSPGRAAPGATVSIEGSGFSSTPAANTVTFNGVMASVTAASL
ncbi:MAG: RHS repeat protein, partial [Chloroflexi bacterium]|nr:RHS repeat protein [Chloroflexota bacterium]